MKYLVIIGDENSSWREDFTVPEEHIEPFTYVLEMVESFNRSRNCSRRIVRMRTKPIDTIRQHIWDKKSLVTERGGFDKMKCSRCGVTGKRYGLGVSGVAIDARYKAKKYENCEWNLKNK